MTDREMNGAIAKACGKEYHKPTEEEIKSGSYYQYEPEFLNDLNACAEMENHIPWEKTGQWIANLEQAMGTIFLRHVICAPARPRCIAFLKTMGLWK